MKQLLCLSLVACLVGAAQAQPTVDGTKDASYGAPLAVQTVETQFGDNTDPNGFGGGGELNAAYAQVVNDRLYVMVTGNIEGSFNKLSLFIDSKAGGENVLSGDPKYDFGDVSQNFAGLTFDAGFEADYHVYGRWGGGAFEVDVVDRQGGLACDGDCAGDFGSASSGAGTGIQSGTILGDGDGTTSYLGSAAEFGFNNTNIAGVAGGTGPADQVAAAAVTTGFEFSIALSDIGSPALGDTILVQAVYGNGDNNFHSNQVLGGLPNGLMNGGGAGTGTGNLGGDGDGNFTGNLAGVDFSALAGDQFFAITVVPEPASALLAGLAVVGLAARRRG